MTAVNKKALAIVALATSVFAVAGCSDIEATPKFYDDPIIKSDDEVTHNVMSVIYDALSNSSSNSQKVLDKVIDILAEDYFGKYEDAKELASGTAAAAKEFMEAHKDYYSADTDEKNFKRLQNFVDDIETRIADSYYDEISNGSYSYRNRYNEEKYAQYLKSQMYAIEDIATPYKDIVLTEKYNDKEAIKEVLHIDAYKDYTNKYLVKKFYKSLLIEQYMFEENYSLLGRSYARQVNYIALPTNSDYPGAAKNLLVAFADKYLEQDYTFEDAKVDYSIIEKAWNGLPEDVADTAVSELLTAANFEKKSITYELGGTSITEDYYPATKYGAMIEKFAKITDDRNTTKNEADFTGSNSYPKEVGYQMECDSIALNDYDTDGWYIKTNSTSLPSELNTRLFNIGVANDVDHLGVDGKETEEKSVEYKLGDYVAKKNGKYWLVPATSEKGDKYNYIIFDSASSTYYMIQVVEAASTSKLSTNADNTSNYANLRHDDMLAEKVSREIAKLYNSNDTYKNNAYLKYLEKYGILFYDEDVYAYFEEKYPDLFDDED